MVMRLVETYSAVQGEGPHVGEKTVFARFGGCNLRCPLWPCDTQYAIDAEKYRHEWRRVTPQEVADEVRAIVEEMGISNVSLSGGEPFLQPKNDLLELFAALASMGLTIDVFSNGTLPYPQWVEGYPVHFIMDWKLPGSGENAYDQTRLRNLDIIESRGSVKFVCANEEDLLLAKELYNTYLIHRDIKVYYGVAWGKMENKDLVALVMEHKLPWRLNVQVHNIIFNREDRGI